MKKITPVIFLVICFFFFLQSPAQVKRTWHWYFGFHCGIDFSSGNPVADTTGALESIEGSAVLSDTLGQLMYYTNAEKLWNKNHQLMPHGDSLAGNSSAVQSSLFVPVAGTPYCYLFMNCINNSTGGDELRYCLIDGTLNGGNGDIVPSQKNILLMTDGTEALAGIRHCNGTDNWVVTRHNAQGATSIYAYKVSAAGIAAPVISAVGTAPYWDIVCELGFCASGNMLVQSSFGADLFIYDFDNSTGLTTPVFTFPILSVDSEMVYSTEFSPDNKKLYVSSWKSLGWNYISQFDLSASQPWLTRVKLDSVDYTNGSPNGYGFTGRLQQGPDGRIYLSRWNQLHPYQVNPNTFYSLDSLDAILYPNIVGIACQFQPDFLYLEGMPTMIGLPNFIESDFDTVPFVPGPCTEDAIAENEISPVNVMTIFPNPAPENSFVHLHLATAADEVIVYSMSGEEVYRAKMQPETEIEISTATLRAGIYFVRAMNRNEAVATGRFVVE